MSQNEMKLFIGAKRVLAMAMSRGEYNDYRGWECSANEDPQDAGYLVEYLDGGESNHPNHEGYISWSPASPFEKANVCTEGFFDSCHIAQYFRYEHLPPVLQQVSQAICQTAIQMSELPNTPEKAAGMRKLLEAKDCFVRAAIPAKND